jgi:hypothetical protein
VAVYLIVSPGYTLPRGYRMRVDRIESYLTSRNTRVKVFQVCNIYDAYRLYCLVKKSDKDDVFIYENIGVALMGIVMPESKKILDYHGSIYDASFRKDFVFRRVLYLMAEAIIVRRWSFVIVVSQAFMELLENKYAGRLKCTIKVVPNIPAKLPAYPRLKQRTTKIKIVYVGGTQDWQRPSDMIKWLVAFNSYAEKRSRILSCTFLTNEKTQFKELLSKVTFEYKIYSTNQDGVFKELSKNDFALLFRHEDEINHVACPTKAVEYLLAGIPVLATKGIGDISGLIEKYKAGIVLEEPLVSPSNFRRVLSFQEEGKVPKKYFDIQQYDGLLL